MLQLLIVEDEYYIRKKLVSIIDWGKLQIEVAADVESLSEAISVLKEKKIHLILSDILLGAESGLQLAEYVCRFYPDIRFVFLTGYNKFEYAQEAIDYGVSSYLLKPVNKEKLCAVMKTLAEQIYKKQQEAFEEDGQKEGKTVSEKNASGVRKNQTVQMMMKEIESRYSDFSLSLETLAQQFGYSKAYCSDMFKKNTGYSVVEYITMCRMTQAQKLLCENPDEKISVICRKVGYQNPFYFSRRFKMYFGVAPGQMGNRGTME